MSKKYSNELKSMICNLICNEHASTSLTAQQFDIPLKTVEHWVTSFNKDNHCFDSNYLSPQQQIDFWKKRVRELEKNNDILKKTISLIAKKQ